MNPCSSIGGTVNQLEAPFSFASVTARFVSGSRFASIFDSLLISCSVFLCAIILVASFISATFGRLVPWGMIRATKGAVIDYKFSSSLLVFSLNNGIPKPPDRTVNEYNYLSFSKIVSPINAGSKKFCTTLSTGFIRSLISGMVRKK